jgi:hypothetical protein
MESGISEVERIRAEIVNSMQWSDYEEEEEEEEEYICCFCFNFF